MTDFTDHIDLASERLGGKALWATDDFFAEKENLLKPGRGIFIADKYTDNGKWMDGWESRRKRTTGHDTCIVKLGCSGVIKGFDIDTNHFLGNYPEHASVDACWFPGDPSVEALQQAEWTELLPISELQGGSQNLFAVTHDQAFTHVRLHIYPDGGVARFRVHGEVVPDWERLVAGDGMIDLAAVEHGGVALLCNDMFFSHRNNLLMPGRSANMGDGWETRRRRAPGNDWLILRLGKPGRIRKVEVDTNHFKGNFPESCSLEAAVIPHDVPPEFLTSRSIEWKTLLPRTKLEAHKQHYFEQEVQDLGTVTHVRLSIYPDGGVSRLRLHGNVSD